ncbi:MAG: hypothetical protein JXR60_09480 [Bacteroidales bacterium]|nr:hypothetical protein [Bacteroidales bacterium]
MCLLDKHQVLLIRSDVKQAGITLSHLSDDLIDHICCEVETLMYEGQSFAQAYETVKSQTGISVLKKIQDDTQFLIDKNYRLMKTSMKITGNIALALVMFGTVFKIIHWPGASIILSLGFLITVLAFFPLAVYVNYQKVNEKKNLWLHLAVFFGGITFMMGVAFKIQHWHGASWLLFAGYISLIFAVLPIVLFSNVKKVNDKKDKRIYTIGFIAMFIFVLSSMFKLFHWPGASILMLLGSFLLISVFLPFYTWRHIQKEGRITGQFIYTIILSMFLVLFTSLVAINVSEKSLANFIDHSKNENLIEDYLYQNNRSQVALMNDSLLQKSQIKSIKKTSDSLCEYITDIQGQLIRAIDTDNTTEISLLIQQPERIVRKDNSSGVYSLMIGNSNNGKAYMLKRELERYKKLIFGVLGSNNEMLKKTNFLFDLSNNTKFGKEIPWELYHFQNTTLAGCLAFLNNLQTAIRINEAYALETLLTTTNQ